ncbi:MAG: hypothetical protein J6J41_03525, partial [Clostridia bacterium]|nr:hypothetical protein [Clostridia bacterium]
MTKTNKSGKTPTILMAAVAIVAVILCIVFVSQKGGLQKQINDATAAAETAKAEAEKAVADAKAAGEQALADEKAAAETAQAELQKQLDEA